jgi:hypothetical protein
MSKSNSVKMVLNRDKTLATTHGHTIGFKKGVPVSVPTSLVREALEIGAQPVDQPHEEVSRMVAEPETPENVTDPVQRTQKIRDAIELIVKTNQREDFLGTGIPSARAVNRMITFEVQQKDVNRVWQLIRDEENE